MFYTAEALLLNRGLSFSVYTYGIEGSLLNVFVQKTAPNSFFGLLLLCGLCRNGGGRELKVSYKTVTAQPDTFNHEPHE